MTERNKKLIRNSTTAEFLIFTRQVGEQSVKACYKDEYLVAPEGICRELGLTGDLGQSTQKITQNQYYSFQSSQNIRAE